MTLRQNVFGLIQNLIISPLSCVVIAVYNGIFQRSKHYPNNNKWNKYLKRGLFLNLSKSELINTTPKIINSGVTVIKFLI